MTPWDSKERPLKVVHVIGGLALGGAETLLFRLATQDLPGVEQEVICLGPPDWYSAQLEERGIRVHHLDMNSPLETWSSGRRLRKLLRERRPDAVQSWLYFANMLSSVSAGSDGPPVVWSNHTSHFEGVGLASRLSAYAGGAGVRRLARFVINCSQTAADWHARIGYSNVPNAVIHNGYDPTVFTPDETARRETRRALGIGDDLFLIGSVARWHVHKDIPTLLKAVRLAADEGVPLRCLLIGRGLDAGSGELLSEIRRTGCKEVVYPLGPRSDVPDLARALDLHVLASRNEAFPNVVAETMLSGTPNVVTDVGDSALMVGDTGWVVPRAEPVKLAAAIVGAWKERTGCEPEWEARRNRARARIADNFTFEKMAEAYANIWRQVARTA